MKQYDLDRIIDRENTQSIKFDHEKSQCCLPMWIADMDFAVADEIVEAAKKRAEHPIFGYSYLPDALFDAFIRWHRIRHGIEYRKEDIIPYYSVVAAIDLILNTFTQPGDNITIMSPVYVYFWEALKETQRTALASPLINYDNRYSIDFDNLEACFSRSKVFLMCSPHNPAGRVWTHEELERIAALAERYDVMIIADEIHSDLIMPGYRHIPFSSLGSKTADRTITLLSSTKTFNLAQAGMSFMVTQNRQWASILRGEMCRFHLGAQNVFAAVMVQAAYEHGEDWLNQVLTYINGNYLLIRDVLTQKMPEIKILPLEGTYLIWLDCRNLPACVTDFFENQAHILGEDGSLFGPEGAGYYRINIATPRRNIEKMLAGMEETYRKCGCRRS